ncbi:hypothetical protein APR11_000378 [Nocardia amikacinitolerans]|uniref:hypothetical protein n=1 Tax=Nocardia amikacinitolerans TaxID=756689 RepID=UPI0020A3862E|nr:hypothetical protein [Nocardia amikacinitolerans]MCP2293974.1 hypothetical protein [Nocardia amikacinitolerans]
MTDSNSAQTDEFHVIDLVGHPLHEWLRDWIREEALRRIEPALERMFDPALKRITALLGCDEDPGNPHDG